MIIVAFEGLDKSGKHTQVTKLHDALSRLGYKVESSEFHRYDTPTGQLIRRFLDGDYKVNQLAIECIMAADKYAQLDWFDELEEQGLDILLLDRYTLSQFAYGSANGISQSFTHHLLSELTYPDFTFYLDISPEESMKRKGQHGANDIYESNKQLLENAATYYKWANQHGLTVSLDATQSVDTLHSQILKDTLSLLDRGATQ